MKKKKTKKTLIHLTQLENFKFYLSTFVDGRKKDL